MLKFVKNEVSNQNFNLLILYKTSRKINKLDKSVELKFDDLKIKFTNLLLGKHKKYLAPLRL